jgi:spore coat polysaccharide biosynthesis predicted glycosyltransferase SpsG
MKYLKKLCFFALTAILFSSCGSISISQKRYSNGLNIAWFSGKDDVQDTKKTPKKSHVKPIETVQTKVIAAEDEVLVTATETNENLFESVASDAPIMVLDIMKNAQVTKASQKELAADKQTQKQIRKINKLQKALQLSKVQETHDGGGALKTIGWIFIILGIIFVLIISILIGVLFMLLGLLFVIAGK